MQYIDPPTSNTALLFTQYFRKLRRWRTSRDFFSFHSQAFMFGRPDYCAIFE